MRDFRTMTPSSRRSTAMSRGSHSILRKAGFSSTAAAFPLILRLPKYRSVFGLLSSLDIDRLSLFEKGPDAFVEIFRTALLTVVPGTQRPITTGLCCYEPRRPANHQTDACGYGSPLSRGRRQNVRYRGAMRMAPSRRMVSPFSIGFSTMWTARLPYSLASP